MIDEAANAPPLVRPGLRVVIRGGADDLASALSSNSVSLNPMTVVEAPADSSVPGQGADWVTYTSHLIDALRAALPESEA
jgi:hypothetical protein